MGITKIQADSRWKIVSSAIVLDPKFAVKELIDNAIDSGAANVYVDVDSKTCGCDYISVRDDGSGVSCDDIDLMCINHSTSKISSYNDLGHLSTLGFRGEALFSLATLSNQKGSMEITTKTGDDRTGHKWSVGQSGEIKNNKKSTVSCPKGTTVVVRNLIGGLRSRRIQVSSRALKNIEEFKNMINHYSLNARNVRFYFSLVKLAKNGTIIDKQLQHSLNTKLSKVRVLSNIGQLRKPTSDNFLVMDDLEVSDLITLEVILPKMRPEFDVVNIKKPKKFFSVNDRVMSLKFGLGHSFNKVISSTYRHLQLLEPMIWYVNLHCSMSITDVNIEPGKDDIFIRNTDTILLQVKEALTSYLSRELGLKRDAVIAKGSNQTDFEGAGPANAVNNEPVDELESNEKTAEKKAIITRSPSESFATDGEQEGKAMTAVIAEENPSKCYSARSKIQLAEDLHIRDTNRTLTIGSMTSDDGDWSRSLLQNDTSDAEILQNKDSDMPSSLKFNCDDPANTNEDPGLSKNINISNPFIPTKLQMGIKPGRNGSTSSDPVEKREQSVDSVSSRGTKPLDASESVRQNLPQRTIDESFISDDRVKIRKLTRMEENKLLSLQFKPIRDSETGPSYNDTTLVNGAARPLPNGISLRQLKMFSEYTNSYRSSLNYNLNETTKNSEREAKWLQRVGDPSDNLIRGLENSLKASSYHEKMLTKAEEGWHLLSI